MIQMYSVEYSHAFLNIFTLKVWERKQQQPIPSTDDVMHKSRST